MMIHEIRHGILRHSSFFKMRKISLMKLREKKKLGAKCIETNRTGRIVYGTDCEGTNCNGMKCNWNEL